ncbi:MAG: hypothetical protein ACRC5A_12410 [Enterobacteriaceae bacterium]
MKYSDEELALLTDEEKADLLEEEEESLPGEDDDMDDTENTEDSSPEAQSAPQEQETAPAPPEESTAPTAENLAREPVQIAPQPLFNAVDTSAIDEQLKALEQQKAAILRAFEEGEMEAAEYQRALDKQMDEWFNLKSQMQKAELVREATENEAIRRWNEDVADFLTEHREIADNPIRYAALDNAVRILAADEANQGVSNTRLLRMAWQQYCDAFPSLQTPEPPKPVQPKAPPVDKAEIPPVLARVPAAEINDTDDGQFAALERLSETDPLSYEDKLATLSEAERERYLMGA